MCDTFLLAEACGGELTNSQGKTVKMNHLRFVNTALVAMLATAAISAHAGPISGVVASTNSSQITGFLIGNIVDGSGLSSYTTSATHATPAFGNYFVSAASSGGTITFDLGAVTGINGMAVWNFNDSGPVFGIHALTIDQSLDGTSFTPIAGAPTSFAIGNNGGPELAQLFSFAATTRFVRFDVMSSDNRGNFALNEVMFTTPDSRVPEPGIGALAALGVAAMVLSRRVRRSSRPEAA